MQIEQNIELFDQTVFVPSYFKLKFLEEGFWQSSAGYNKLLDIAPLGVELDFVDDVKLVLILHWGESFVEIYQLHKFDKEYDEECVREDAVRHQFITSLLDEPGVLIDLPDRVKVGDAKAIKFLHQAGIKGVLRNLFLQKTTTLSAMLKARYISLQDQPISTIKKILKHIRKLKPLKRRNFKNQKEELVVF